MPVLKLPPGVTGWRVDVYPDAVNSSRPDWRSVVFVLGIPGSVYATGEAVAQVVRWIS